MGIQCKECLMGVAPDAIQCDTTHKDSSQNKCQKQKHIDQTISRYGQNIHA